MYTRVLTFLALVYVVRSNDVIVGLKTDGRKFFDENRQANPALWRQMDNVTIKAPENEVISRVVITDLRPEKDGDVKVVEGGEGHNNVTIELKSPTVLRGYEFHIEVFSLPQDHIPVNNDQQGTTEIIQSEPGKTTEVTGTDNQVSTSKTPDSSTNQNVPAILANDEEIKDSAREGRNAKNENISTEGTTEITSTTLISDTFTTQQTESATENQSDKTSDINKQEHQAFVPPIPLNRNISINPTSVVSESDITSNKDNNDAKDESRHVRDTEAEKSAKSPDNKLDLMHPNLHLFDSTTENDKEASTTEVSDVKPVEEKSTDDKDDDFNAPKAHDDDNHKDTSIIPSKVEYSANPLIVNDAEKLRSARDVNEQKINEGTIKTESGISTTETSKDAETSTLTSDECVTSVSEDFPYVQNPLNAMDNQGTRNKVYLNDKQWNERLNNPRFHSIDAEDQKSPDDLKSSELFSQSTISPDNQDAEMLGNEYKPSPDHMENKNPKISAIAGLKGENVSHVTYTE